MGPTDGILPNGLDRADGLDGRIGTPTPAAAVATANANGVTQGTQAAISIEEAPDSPTIERGERATIIHKYRGLWNVMLNQITQYGRGTPLTDSEGNVTRILTALLQHDKPDHGILTLTAESLSFDTPPDTFSIATTELGVNIIKYPRYFNAFNPSAATDEDWETNILLNQDIVRALQNYFENTSSQYRDTLTYQLQASIGYPGTLGPNNSIVHGGPTGGIPITLSDATQIYIQPLAGTDYAKGAALEIIQKYWRNEETPYIVGITIRWSVYTYAAPYMNLGGYVEDPILEATPALPEYFWQPIQNPDGSYQYPQLYQDGINTIFDALSILNPQCYSETGVAGGPVSISWLRRADQQDEQLSWWKTDREWFGAVIGNWDADLYNQNDRPTSYADYSFTSAPEIMHDDVAQAAISAVSLIVIPT